MRDETRKKLDGIASSERWPTIAVGVVGVLAVALGVGGVMWSGERQGRDFNGTMKAMLLHFDDEEPRLIVDMRVLLDDGRLVRVLSQTSTAPPPGTKIIVSERVSWFGWPTLFWDGRLQ